LKNLIEDPSKVFLSNISFRQYVTHIDGKAAYISQTQKIRRCQKYAFENVAIIGIPLFKGWMVGRQITSIDAKID